MERLDRGSWVKAARLALLSGGPSAVRVEKLATSLGVTKGSFYWHFKDRQDLLEDLLQEWENESDLLVALEDLPSERRLPALLEQLANRVRESETGEIPSDAAVFAWATVSPEVAARVTAAEQERIALLTKLVGDRPRAEVFYMAYLGYVLRRRHAPDAENLFALLKERLLEFSAGCVCVEPAA